MLKKKEKASIEPWGTPYSISFWWVTETVI